jgi:hypothetical protein
MHIIIIQNFLTVLKTVIPTQRKQPLLDYTSFKNRAIFVIDCSQRNESLK